MTVHIKTTRRSAMMAALLAAFDEGSGAAKLRVYDGTQAANADTAPAGTLLLEFTLQDPAFTESGGVITLDVTPTISTTGITNGTATWVRFVDSDAEAVIDATVGTEVTLSDTTVETGQTYSITSGSFTLPA